MEFIRRQHRGLPAALQHVRHLADALERSADLLQLLHGLRRLDEQAVGAGFEIHLAAPQCVVEAVHGARVGACDDVEVAAVARGGRGADLSHHLVGWDHVLAGHVAAALGRDLVLHEDRRHAHALVALDRAGDVLHVAVAGVAVDQDRELRRAHDVADAGADLAECGKADVGDGVARADQRDSRRP